MVLFQYSYQFYKNIINIFTFRDKVRQIQNNMDEEISSNVDLKDSINSVGKKKTNRIRNNNTMI